MNSSEGVQAAHSELKALAAVLRELGEIVGQEIGMQSEVEEARERRAWAVRLGSVSATIRWQPRFGDSLSEAVLRVETWGFAYSFRNYMRIHPDSLSDREYELVLNEADRWVWRSKRPPVLLYASNELADLILGGLIEAAFTPRGSREPLVFYRSPHAAG